MDKNTIIKVSFVMFRQYGVKSVSMDDIAHRLAISKKTLYQYVDNKEDLLIIGISKIFGRLFEDYQLIARLQPHPLTAIAQFYYSILKEISRYESVYFYSINKYSEAIRSEIETQRNKLISEIVKPLFIKANEWQCFHKEVNIDLFIQLHLLMIEEKYNQVKTLSPQSTFDQIYQHLIVYTLMGICKPERVKDWTAVKHAM